MSLTNVADVMAPSFSEPTLWSGKRGLAYNNASLCKPFIGARDISWAYNWASSPCDLQSGINYIPLLWGISSDFTDSWYTNAKSAIAAGAQYLFSFNEPDNPAQANLSPSAAATAYLQYMEPFAGQAKLCAPSVTNGGGSMGLDWLSAFLSECNTCTIDCINIHWYDSYWNADYFKTQVNNASSISGGKPIFVGEFGCTDGSDSNISEFLEDVMPWMDANSNVTGYAYFMISDGLLLSGTSPSTYGETYLNYRA
ncbi:glycoside hydrolase family 128 protein [Acidomyces richmondensis BFW]|nr:glycoside hydrolase family 128 protein [Acidomyces richmondensis BFW]